MSFHDFDLSVTAFCRPR